MKTNFNTKFLFFVLGVIFSSFNLKSATCISQGNGDWSNSATWSCGTVPACGDSIVILAAHNVTISSQQNYTGCGTGPIVVVYGTLDFTNGNKLRLPCNSRIYIMSGGDIDPGTGGGNSNTIEICGDILWNAGSGNLPGPACLPATASWCVGTVLPVELISFTGDAKDGYVDLNWITATESNSSHFEIERSVDATSFSKINTVNSMAPNGNSNRALIYHTIDNSPLGNISYYRLKQFDLDNSSSYSNIISVNYIKAKNVKFVIYPNPNKGEFTADISGIENNHEVQISLKDEKGNTVYDSKFFIQDDNSRKLNIVPETKLPNGLYVCTLTLEGIEYHVKVIVN
ncbi:MAG: T9SS type A sorting domain-containing protein [Bacteroidia bacterium]|nr:T9SS type A sorting domain-containing protein [Bacteroidia bacterium]